MSFKNWSTTALWSHSWRKSPPFPAIFPLSRSLEMLAAAPLFIALLAGSLQVHCLPQLLGDQLEGIAPAPVVPAPVVPVGNVAPQALSISPPSPSPSNTTSPDVPLPTPQALNSKPKPSKSQSKSKSKCGNRGVQYTGDITYYAPGLGACGMTSVCFVWLYNAYLRFIFR